MIETPTRPTTTIDDTSTIMLDQVDRLFERYVTKDRLADADRGEWPRAIWEAVQQAGLPLALVPEAQGGVGLPPVDALRLIRRAAYHTLPIPLGETVIAAALWAEASGERVEGALSLAPTGAADSIELERRGDGYALRGRAPRIPWGAQVEHVLLYARDTAGSGNLALLPRALVHTEGCRNVANEPRETLILKDTILPQHAIRPAPQVCAEGLLPIGSLLRTQQMVGAMERCLEYALTYANERRQFGRPIGKFQAVQLMLADAAGQYAAAEAAADCASETYGRPSFAFTAAVAKARVGEAAGRVAEICHQVHGAIGFTQEHPLHFATRRLWSWRDEFGHEPYWQERIGRLVCRQGGDALWATLVDV